MSKHIELGRSEVVLLQMIRRSAVYFIGYPHHVKPGQQARVAYSAHSALRGFSLSKQFILKLYSIYINYFFGFVKAFCKNRSIYVPLFCIPSAACHSRITSSGSSLPSATRSHRSFARSVYSCALFSSSLSRASLASPL